MSRPITCRNHLIFLHFFILIIIISEECKLLMSSWSSFLQPLVASFRHKSKYSLQHAVLKNPHSVSATAVPIYEGKSVNRSQVDIKHVIFEPGNNIYFSTYPPPTLIHLRFTSASNPAVQKEVFWLLSQPLPRLRVIIWDNWTSLREFLNPFVNRFTRQTLPTVNRKHFFMNTFALSLFPQKNAQQNAALR
jgi:hypothetical protein